MSADLSGLTTVIADVAHAIGLVPLVAVGALRLAGYRPDVSYWWMAAAFGVSFVADFLPHPVAHQLYPIAQAGLFALVLAPRRLVPHLLALIAVAATYSVLWRQGGGLDVGLRIVAWGSVAAVAWYLPDLPDLRTLRRALCAGFTLMTIGWCWYVLVPGWASWLWLQAARGVAAGWWVLALWRDLHPSGIVRRSRTRATDFP